MLRVGFVEGVTPDKWARRWAERFPDNRLELLPLFPSADFAAELCAGDLDMALVRLPIESPELHLVRLYDEEPVVVLGKDHLLTLLDEITDDDLIDEIVNTGPARIAIETAAAGTGVVRLPASVARAYQRKDVVTRPDRSAAPSTVALAWRKDRDDEWTQEFVGVVRGRRANSSRANSSRANSSRGQDSDNATSPRTPGAKRSPRSPGLGSGRRRNPKPKPHPRRRRG